MSKKSEYRRCKIKTENKKDNRGAVQYGTPVLIVQNIIVIT